MTNHDPQNQKTRRERPRSETPYTLYLGSVSGIPIRLHFTFLLLLAWFGLAASGPGNWHGFVFIVAMFGCVILHELGHSIVAQRFGIEVGEIVLYPIGGVARLEKLPKPREELWIALAGPAVNVVIALGLWAYLRAQNIPFELGAIGRPSAGSWWQLLLWSNVVLAVFNMIPAFPMDGGRVLRAALALRMEEVRATQIAAHIGQLLAIAFAFVGLWQSNFVLLFIAFFVFVGAGQEAAMIQNKVLVEGLPVREAMITEFQTLPVGTTLGEAREVLLRTSQTDFPVVHGEEVVGLLSRNALLHGLAEGGPGDYVAGVMEREFPSAAPGASLEEIAGDMQAGAIGCVLVMEGGALLGMVTKENLAELLIIRQIMDRAAKRAQRAA
jgi:Zn-dependent protease